MLTWQEITKRVVKRLHVGIDFVLHVSRKEAEPFARLDRWTAEDDLVHVTADEHVHPNSHGQVCFARACGTNSERQLILKERSDVILLRVRARFDQFLSCFDLYAAALEQLHLIARAIASSTCRRVHTYFSVDIARRHVLTGLKPSIKSVQNFRRLLLRSDLAENHQLIALVN